MAPTHRPGADAPVSPSSTGDTLGGHPAADTCWLPLRPAAQQGGCTPGQTGTAAAAAAQTALSGRDQGQDGHRPPPSPEHFADCLKHHFAAESGFGGLAEQSPVCGEAAVVPQHGGAAQRHRRRAGGHSARSRPPCLTGSQLTRPMRTREGGSGRTQSCSFSRPRGPSPAQRGRVLAAFKLAPLGGGKGRAHQGARGGSLGPTADPSLTPAWRRQDTGRCRPAGLWTPHGRLPPAGGDQTGRAAQGRGSRMDRAT